MSLTINEIKILNAMRNNEFQDSLEDGGTWCFAAVENSGLIEKIARGTISSLVKKNLVVVYKGGGYYSEDEPNEIHFTEEGKKLFDNADGEKCIWGGKRLLKEDEEKGTLNNN